MSKLKTIPLATLAMILAGDMIWRLPSTQAQGKSAVSFRAFGMIGITSGQRVRLNAVPVGLQNELAIELMILDGSGNVLARDVERVAPGHAISLEQPFLPVRSGNRLPVRALIRWPGQLGQDEYVVSTLEVVDDATGRTVLVDPDPEG
jgi:hypothetical protein